MYSIYHTQGIIIGIQNRGEANRVYSILTRDLGVVRAVAQSSRKETSKMRYGLQLLDHSCVDCVYGRDFWRIIGIEAQLSGSALVQPFSLWTMWNNVARLVERLVPFDEVHVDLYETIYDVYIFSIHNTLSDAQVFALEKIVIIRLLARLGYWHDDQRMSFISRPLSLELLLETKDELRFLTQSINTSLQATQL